MGKLINRAGNRVYFDNLKQDRLIDGIDKRKGLKKLRYDDFKKNAVNGIVLRKKTVK